jgi:hypothetical protein
MFRNERRIAIALSVALAAVASTGVAMGQTATGKLTGQNADLSALPKPAAKMYALVKKPHTGELKWQQIPWLVDLDEGIRVAKDENRPLLLWVSGDDPLEKC